MLSLPRNLIQVRNLEFIFCCIGMSLTLTSNPFSCPDFRRCINSFKLSLCCPLEAKHHDLLPRLDHFPTILMAFLISSPYSMQNNVLKTKLDQITPLLNGHSEWLNIALRIKSQLLTMPSGPTWSGHHTIFQLQRVILFLLLYTLQRGKLQPRDQIHTITCFCK